MANTKISAMTLMTEAQLDAQADYVPIIDASDAADYNKRIYAASLTKLAIQNKTANYTIVAADHGTAINVTANGVTLSVTGAATLGNGFWCDIILSGTNASCVIDPSGAETVNGLSTWTFQTGQGARLVCNGTLFYLTAARPAYLYSERSFPGATGVASATANGAVALGASLASGSDSFSIGGSSPTASATRSGAIGADSGGTGSSASGAAALALMGGNASTSDAIAAGKGAVSAIVGKLARAGGSFASAGDAQMGLTILRAVTIDATVTPLTSDGNAAATTNQVILPNNSAYRVRGNVVAMQQAADGTATAAYSFIALVRRGANAASTTLPYSLVTTDFETTGAWDLTLAADTTNGGLTINATGAAATDIRWVCTAETSEVTYA